MFKYSVQSKNNLATCHQDLQKLFNEVIKNYDCSILQGWRSNEEQEELFKAGRSKLRAKQSKHNKNPSLAVDVVPYPVDWDDKDRFYHFAGYVKGVADTMGIKIRWGGDWNNNNSFDDQTFDDLPHFELINKV
jgi:peptidoglycan L-alanyl-D-glutamate endopeptidase CwlK